MSLFPDFPKLTGPYNVACHDLEWGMKKRGQTKSTVLLKLFYPAHITKHDQFANWLPHEAYSKALCDINELPSFVKLYLCYAAMQLKIPVYADAQLKKSSASSGYPVIIFSHGIRGNRHLYSSVCSDLASHGYVVAAIEHRDGSGCLAQGPQGSWIYHDKQPMDSWSLRHEQLAVRQEEVQLCWQTMMHLNDGRIQVDPITRQFAGQLDLDAVTLAGHSFGGATAALILSDPAARAKFRCGLLLDPWVQPLIMRRTNGAVFVGDGDMPRLKAPVACILSEEFTYWPDNFDSVKELVACSDKKDKSLCLTLVGTAHLHQSDILLVLRNVMKFDFRSPFQMDPIRVISLNTEVCARFIQDVCKRKPAVQTKKLPTATKKHTTTMDPTSPSFLMHSIAALAQ
ncbi:platelet-activating factor acetylhydrolase [Gongronella butleri]|nr:platelet-activating factor acetylhydrolase [Gongronella butleri]